MTSIFENEDQEFDAVINDEGQYSVWPRDWDIPNGWTCVGMKGLKAECLRHIEAVWTDMRPRSLTRLRDIEER
jgi:MbtH protein